MFDFFRVPGTTSVHERKVAAWALFVGERRRDFDHADRSVRPHRGMLPDVDPAAAISAGRRPSLISLLAAMTGGRRRPIAEVAVAVGVDPSADAAPSAGKSAAIAYIDGMTDDRLAARDALVQINIVDQFRAA